MSKNSKHWLNSWLSHLILGYQWIRTVVLDPLLHAAFGFTSQCIYEESCSQYAQRMLKEHATIPALGKITRRIASCHSWHPHRESRVQ